MTVSERYLITANVILNWILSKRRKGSLYHHFIQQLIDNCKSQGIGLYMTSFDYFMAFHLSDLCGMLPENEENFNSELEEISKYIKILHVDDAIMECADEMMTNPSDAIRAGSTVCNLLDGIITWEPAHFLPESSPKHSVSYSQGVVQYHNFSEAIFGEEDEFTNSSFNFNIFSVAEFCTQCLDDSVDINSTDPNSPYDRVKYPVIKEIAFKGNIITENHNCDTFFRESETVEITIQMEENGSLFSASAVGEAGIIHTVIQAINYCIQDYQPHLPEYATLLTVPTIPSTGGWGEVIIELLVHSHNHSLRVRGQAQGSLLWAVSTAYLDAVSMILNLNIVAA
jgi:hypothetical protein